MCAASAPVPITCALSIIHFCSHFSCPFPDLGAFPHTYTPFSDRCPSCFPPLPILLMLKRPFGVFVPPPCPPAPISCDSIRFPSYNESKPCTQSLFTFLLLSKINQDVLWLRLVRAVLSVHFCYLTFRGYSPFLDLLLTSYGLQEVKLNRSKHGFEQSTSTLVKHCWGMENHRQLKGPLPLTRWSWLCTYVTLNVGFQVSTPQDPTPACVPPLVVEMSSDSWRTSGFSCSNWRCIFYLSSRWLYCIEYFQYTSIDMPSMHCTVYLRNAFKC